MALAVTQLRHVHTFTSERPAVQFPPPDSSASYDLKETPRHQRFKMHRKFSWLLPHRYQMIKTLSPALASLLFCQDKYREQDNAPLFRFRAPVDRAKQGTDGQTNIGSGE